MPSHLPRLALAAGLALFAVSVGACAQGGGRAQQIAAKLKERFDAADANHDGQLSRDEAAQGMPRLAGQFDAIDANHDGQLSRDELAAYLRERRAARQSGG
ncbi:EF-hand domain-containing protein [Fulvimonas soli]|jgi:Ca2+-binding EF-hand superfamily protein|uniref:EF hand domain-containing protein n=1 Tax=Fulvimonas soli TaxID=155197 RepID=A0A316IBQ5_9GAMM|nr:EF-hand domain-containing protein [Fulvimonas soli]PWK87785.1 EF hand domain-containing protein [Fulvimonas soli]TNY26709.1 hypothetical protein BV497_07275 [Fulvimonas soli]